MFDRTLIALDIECIPGPEIGRAAWSLSGSDAEGVRAMVERREQETEGASRYPALPWHRIVCICAKLLEPRSWTVEMRVLGGPAASEREYLEAFLQLFENTSGPRLVSWNGGGYDLPVMRYRSMKHGLRAPALVPLQQLSEPPPRPAIDVMDVLSGHSSSTRAGLGATAQTLGLPGKVTRECVSRESTPVWADLSSGLARWPSWL